MLFLYDSNTLIFWHDMSHLQGIWDIVGDQVMTNVHKFFEACMNYSSGMKLHTSLPDFEKIKSQPYDGRTPICIVMYKIVSMVLCNRLKEI